MDQAAAPTGERMLHRHPNSSTTMLTSPAARVSFHSLSHSFMPWVLDVDPGKAASPALTGARFSLVFVGERRGRSTRQSPGLKLSKTTGLESTLVAMMRKFPQLSRQDRIHGSGTGSQASPGAGLHCILFISAAGGSMDGTEGAPRTYSHLQASMWPLFNDTHQNYAKQPVKAAERFFHRDLSGLDAATLLTQ